MVHGGFVVVCGGLWWFSCGGLWWSMVVCGGSAVVVSWWFVVVQLWWFVVVFSPKISRERSCDPLFNQSQIQIHYEISFLMRLLICPFPFKEHTSIELCYKSQRFDQDHSTTQLQGNSSPIKQLSVHRIQARM